MDKDTTNEMTPKDEKDKNKDTKEIKLEKKLEEKIGEEANAENTEKAKEDTKEEPKEEEPTMLFSDFGFEDAVQESLDVMGFIKPTPIQMQAMPIIQEGKDLIACAQTGTGKTAAFLLPILNKIYKDEIKNFCTLIIAPTRELAIQIDRQIEGFSYFLNLSSCPVHGGGDPVIWGTQQRAFTNGTEIIVGTPGRLLAHLDFKYADTSNVQFLILDEADRMLDMGFSDDINRIIEKLPKKRQNLMFSATMPAKIRTLAKEILTDPAEVSIAISKPAENIKQSAYMTYDNQKYRLLKMILKERKDDTVIVFCASKRATKEIAKDLKNAGFGARAMHSDLEQEERQEVMQKFVAKRFNIFVATDVLSRGIDVEDIGLVINYDVPHDPEDYIHRIGRTARAEAKGAAITFINPKDVHKFQRIEKMMERKVDKTPLPKSLGAPPEYKSGSRGGGGRFGNKGRGGSYKSKSGGGSNRGGSGNKRRSGGGNSNWKSKSKSSKSNNNSNSNNNRDKNSSKSSNSQNSNRSNNQNNKSNRPNSQNKNNQNRNRPTNSKNSNNTANKENTNKPNNPKNSNNNKPKQETKKDD